MDIRAGKLGEEKRRHRQNATVVGANQPLEPTAADSLLLCLVVAQSPAAAAQRGVRLYACFLEKVKSLLGPRISESKVDSPKSTVY
jgi:hypothetical protein